MSTGENRKNDGRKTKLPYLCVRRAANCVPFACRPCSCQLSCAECRHKAPTTIPRHKTTIRRADLARPVTRALHDGASADQAVAGQHFECQAFGRRENTPILARCKPPIVSHGANIAVRVIVSVIWPADRGLLPLWRGRARNRRPTLRVAGAKADSESRPTVIYELPLAQATLLGWPGAMDRAWPAAFVCSLLSVQGVQRCAHCARVHFWVFVFAPMFLHPSDSAGSRHQQR